jgi:hypothetical protein
MHSCASHWHQYDGPRWSRIACGSRGEARRGERSAAVSSSTSRMFAFHEDQSLDCVQWPQVFRRLLVRSSCCAWSRTTQPLRFCARVTRMHNLIAHKMSCAAVWPLRYRRSDLNWSHERRTASMFQSTPARRFSFSCSSRGLPHRTDNGQFTASDDWFEYWRHRERKGCQRNQLRMSKVIVPPRR